ncbi:hypothetical protein BpHYR1_032009 [Brachionus plicatilis]|uniref:Uncharacterized protein n=1 Tax=Brachionus plicatilis TaxID=10195 RepID=A0A3M7T1H9_BRAPC|nr:hypothetical protein BpHYR1_032009 [Brachionus plicatilis]
MTINYLKNTDTQTQLVSSSCITLDHVKFSFGLVLNREKVVIVLYKNETMPKVLFKIKYNFIAQLVVVLMETLD